ncbi:MAG: hypothetical protein ACE5IY_21725 [bacterium]
MQKTFFVLTFVLSTVLAISGCQKTEEQEQQAAGEVASGQLTDAQVVQAIEAHILAKVAAEGAYAIEDEVEGRTRKLTLDYVHSSVHPVDDGSYYACADMKEGASTLDLDFYVRAANGQAKVSKVVIHKIDGVSRKE